MKAFRSRTFRLGPYTITTTIDRIIVLNVGGGGVRSYIFRKNPFVGMRRRTLAAIFVSPMVVGALVFALFSVRPMGGEDVNDEEKKNLLLLSSRTDFSAPAEEKTLQIRTHLVKNGETLGKIAREYGVSMDTICGSNRLTSYDIIPTGTLLKIPSRDGILHTMKKGQDIHAVAAYYRIPLSKIMAENRIRNYDFIPDGVSVFIPDAKPMDLVPGFIWPTAGRMLTCGYGWRNDPLTSERDFHKGLDIRANYEWVKATKYGKVTYAGWLGGYGLAVLIAHPGGYKSLYGHLSRITVREGQYVKQGQVIARSGNTGRSTGPHLHFELIRSGAHLNPRGYLK
ncbi:MAG TPA: peptidoglycan DD-metalloendopeptidase family protein [Spirochaetota bacterium]|nr:MAG: Murein DD-endopeptidase MepM [Spirochaetes bacterium ADurb.BinA120]HPI13079.1 peptidoglycan DD-metalloendopeptidase family protein [Spirochaetota bacterium]